MQQYDDDYHVIFNNCQLFTRRIHSKFFSDLSEDDEHVVIKFDPNAPIDLKPSECNGKTIILRKENGRVCQYVVKDSPDLELGLGQSCECLSAMFEILNNYITKLFNGHC